MVFLLTFMLRWVLWMERLYIIWGYSVAMDSTEVWLLGGYLIGPFKVMMALLFSISIDTSGGPKLAIDIDKNISFILAHSKCYKSKMTILNYQKVKFRPKAAVL